MAGRADIQAGRAYVSLYVNSSGLVKGLQAAGQRLQSFGTGIAKIGGLLTGAGGAVLATLGGMVKMFSDAGSAIADMSARTGVSAENLSALGYAAGMTGASMEDVEKAIRKMQQKGFSADQLGAIADKMAKMTDPAKRTAYAMEIFGKSGTAMIPMLSNGAAGLEQFRAEAQRLGMIMSTEDAEAADQLGDSLDRLKGTVKVAGMQIGAALAPAITWLAQTLAETTAKVIRFVRDNRGLVVQVAAVAAAIAGVGTALVALGGTITIVGVALSGLASVFGVILSPIGLVVAGLAAATAAFLTLTNTGRWASGELMGDFGEAWRTIKDMVGGIVDALSAGDIGLAARIAMTGLKTAFFEATKSIRTAWINFNKALVDFAIRAAKAVIQAFLWASRKAAGWLAELGYQINLLIAGQADYLTDEERLRIMTGALDDYYDRLAAGLIGTIDSMGDAIQDSLDANLTEGEDRIRRLRGELGKLRADAAVAAEKARRERAKAPDVTKPGAVGLAAKDMTAATFSAAALAALGQGGGIQKQIHGTLRDQLNQLKNQVKEIKRLPITMAEKLNMIMSIQP